MPNLAIYESTAYLTPGVAANAADVEVRLVSTGALAAIWSNEAGTTPITNPAIAFTDAEGAFKFYAAGVDRGYTVKVTKGAATKTITTAIGTAGQLDQSAFFLKSSFVTDGYVPVGSGGTQIFTPPALGYNLVGGHLVWSVAGSVLTCAVKAWSGADPSAAEPVFIPFRSVTPGTGSLVYRKLITATAISINSTALLGTSNNVAFRLWCVAFDDGGTVRLAIINCLSGTNIYPLAGWGIATSVLEDNASDAAHVFYSDAAAVTAKAYAVLGEATWETGLATAGTWSAAPTRAQLFGPGVLLPGQVVQTVRTQTGASATGTTVVPDDDTIPQATEGDQYMSQVITPSSAANVLFVEVLGHYSNSTTAIFTQALFQDAVANALATAKWVLATVGRAGQLAIRHWLLAGVSTSTTFKVRAGGDSAGTTTFNGEGGARKHGGVLSSWTQVNEVKA